MTKDELNNLKKQLSPDEVPKKKIHLLSSGSKLLNLACSGKTSGAFAEGKYYLFIGDSSSGKTFVTLTCFAEAILNPYFKEYRLIYDPAEDGAMMDKQKFFGKEVDKRIESPSKDSESSNTLEEFYFNADNALDDGKPFIYILDSIDVLDTEADEKHFQKKKNSKDKETSGSYGTEKAKLNSSHMRRLISKLKHSKSILIIISQSRENIGFGATFTPKTRAGGKALKFYASLELWSSVVETIKKKVKGKNRQIGIKSRISIKKNRINGRESTIDIPIYWSTGIDDTGSMVEYLIEEGHWKSVNGKIFAEELGVNLSKEGLIEYIEENNLEKELTKIVSQVWKEILEATEVKRKRRYN